MSYHFGWINGRSKKMLCDVYFVVMIYSNILKINIFELEILVSNTYLTLEMIMD